MMVHTGQLFSQTDLDHNQLNGAALDYDPGFYPAAQADELMLLLKNHLDWRHEPITLFGKKLLQPRLTCWIADDNIRYKYSSIELLGKGWPDFFEPVRRVVEAAAGVGFNSLLANYYRDGQDSMGWHADDEPELGSEPIIASISFGEARRFVLRQKANHRQKFELLLEHGSLLLMRGGTQQNWQHCVPRTQNITGPRINLTFRQIKPME